MTRRPWPAATIELSRDCSTRAATVSMGRTDTAGVVPDETAAADNVVAATVGVVEAPEDSVGVAGEAVKKRSRLQLQVSFSGVARAAWRSFRRPKLFGFPVVTSGCNEISSTVGKPLHQAVEVPESSSSHTTECSW